MARKKNSQVGFMQLKKWFVESIDWPAYKRLNVTSDGFSTWCRNRKDSDPINFPPSSWRPLRLGEPVAEPLVIAFHEYLRVKGAILGKTLADIAEVAEPIEEGERGIFGWTKDFIDLFPHLSRPTAVPDNAYCKNETDLLYAADMIMQNLALKAKGIRLRDEAIDYAETIMKISLASLVDMLRMFWKLNAHTILFTINGSRKDLPERVAVSVAAPCVPDHYLLRRLGEVESISSADLQERSLYFWLFALSEHPEVGVKKASALRSMQTIRTLIFQAAAMMPSLSEGGHAFHFLTQAATTEAQSRARSHGWRSTGTLTHDSGIPQFEFAPPTFATHGTEMPAAQRRYEALRTLMSGVQADIRFQEWLDSGFS